MRRKKLLLILFAIAIIAGSVGISVQPVLAEEEEVSTAYFRIFYEQQVDLFLGKAGVFMLSSGYNATTTLNRFDPKGFYPTEGLEFYDRWLDFGIYDYYGNAYQTLYGFNYAYFNLKYHTRKLWDQGELSIYRWDSSRKDWVKCHTYLVEMKNLPHGRLTCIMTTFGTYGIATEK